ncbi:hypothetical protein ACHAXS_004191 [Conticribra weissflogii]
MNRKKGPGVQCVLRVFVPCHSLRNGLVIDTGKSKKCTLNEFIT